MSKQTEPLKLFCPHCGKPQALDDEFSETIGAMDCQHCGSRFHFTLNEPGYASWVRP